LRDSTPLPTKFHIYQKWVNKSSGTEGELLIEDDCRWAVNASSSLAQVCQGCLAALYRRCRELDYPRL